MFVWGPLHVLSPCLAIHSRVWCSCSTSSCGHGLQRKTASRQPRRGTAELLASRPPAENCVSPASPRQGRASCVTASSGQLRNHFRPIMGNNARSQPGSLQDVLLHETAVSWLRTRLTRSTPKNCWDETREQYGRRLKRCCEEVNKECDVEGLCQGFPKRMKRLKDKEGERLPH